MGLGGLAYLQNLPGIDASVETTENEPFWGPNAPAQWVGGTIDASAIDSGGSPTTLLRRGLLMGLITSSGKLSHYDPAETDGSQVPVGVLYQSVNMYDPAAGATREKQGRILVAGNLKVNSLYGFDEYARTLFGGRFLFDDNRYPHLTFRQVVAKTANYTVTLADNGKEFTTTGAAGAVTFTLPAIGTAIRGVRYRFRNTVGQNMAVVAPANKLVTFNNATATSVTFSTAGNLIGACVEITADEAGTKWLTAFSGANTVTVA
jgi:hypothetical protein